MQKVTVSSDFKPFEIAVDWTKQIGGVQIDNATRSWLLLTAGLVTRYIPPQTVGVGMNIIPTSTRINISYVAAPAGGATSINDGGPVTVTTFDYNVGENAGTLYTVQTGINQVQATLNSVLASIQIVQTNTAVGGPLEVDLASIVTRTGFLNTPQFRAQALTFGTVYNFQTPSSNGIWLLGIQNLSSNPEKIWVADSGWSLAANVRSQGYEILAGSQRGFLMSNDYLTITPNSVNFSVRLLTAFID